MMENFNQNDNQGASSSKPISKEEPQTDQREEHKDNQERMDEDREQDRYDDYSYYTASSTSVYSRQSRRRGDVGRKASRGNRMPDRKRNVRNGRVDKHRTSGRRRPSKHTQRAFKKRTHHYRSRGRQYDKEEDRHDQDRGKDRRRNEDRGRDRGRDEGRGRDRGQDEGRDKDRVQDDDRNKDRERSLSPLNDPSPDKSSHRCKRCGHHCCRRRSRRRREMKDKNERRRREERDNAKISKHMKKVRDQESRKNKKHLKTGPRNAEDKRNNKKEKESEKSETSDDYKTEATQAGSASFLLSPLLVSTDTTLNDDCNPQSDSDQKIYLQITPEMIYDTMQYLAKWRQINPLPPILNYIETNYPVNPNLEELTEELTCKLYVGTVAGILEETTKDDVKHWCLKNELLQRSPTKTEVTIFWEIYTDTMSPASRREPTQEPQEPPTNDEKTQIDNSYIPSYIV